MKKRFLILLMAFVSAAVFAQASLDPNDRFYQDAKNWETKKIISWLPQVRPYPAKTIRKILETVKEKGDEEDIELADYYMNKFFSKSWNLGFTVGDSLRASTSEDVKNMIYAEPSFFGNLEFLNIVSLGYKIGVFVQNASLLEDEVCPMFKFRLTDTHDDPAYVGPLKGNIDMASNVTIGNDSLYGNLGLNRIAFGPFLDDSVLLNGKQFHSGNFLFNYDSEKWSYSQTVSVLSRSPYNGETINSYFKPEKYLAFHSVRLTPCDWFAFSYFEASVYSNRFDPSYFIPVPYMVLQCMYGAADNLLSGVSFQFRPVERLDLSLSTVIDDIDLNGLATGDFGTRLKLALMAGVNYVPPVSFVENLSFDYTLVTPYTYSHSDPSYNKFGDPETSRSFVDHYNKDNFTTRLQSLGTAIPPNSDRLQFAASFKPVDRLKLDLTTSFTRHGNIAESFSNGEAKAYIAANTAIADMYNEKDYIYPNYSTDGSIWTSPMYPAQNYPDEINQKYNCTPTASRNLFLSQEHLMYIFQCGINAEYELPKYKWGCLSFHAGYMFEYIYNKGVDSNIYKAVSGITYKELKDGSKEITDSHVTAQKNEWMQSFHNQFNNYFVVGVTYRY